MLWEDCWVSTMDVTVAKSSTIAFAISCSGRMVVVIVISPLAAEENNPAISKHRTNLVMDWGPSSEN